MQQLETQIRYQNRLLRQLAREGLSAIYEVLLDGGVRIGFEVIRIKMAPAETKFGKSYPERELYPSSSKNSSYVFLSISLKPQLCYAASLKNGCALFAEPRRDGPSTRSD